MNTIKKINEIIENVETNADIEAAYRKSLFHWDIKNQEVSCVKGYVAHEIVSYYYSDETDEKINWMTIEKNEPVYNEELGILIPDLPKFDPKRYYSFMIKDNVIIPVKVAKKKIRSFNKEEVQEETYGENNQIQSDS
ncbi:hypothetical protein LNN31_16330 [Acetobacterium wieringae]|uniref:DUF551 domain-containing protein n=1 Tax=Acetobacterium wieringae TaxID=52694 RepID=A0ABY6HCX9_9FIRM|nr:hypothetical protein [Acetobacterium wieringae]UYO62337.1 hypothetical protein LNN31_16330 [Acetobacterium wieringae]VUZ23012.1 Uncharacterised protein [Acetobacterium wieringae]